MDRYILGDYFVVEAISRTDLEHKVVEMLNKGYELVGGVSVRSGSPFAVYMQAVLLKKGGG